MPKREMYIETLEEQQARAQDEAQQRAALRAEVAQELELLRRGGIASLERAKTVSADLVAQIRKSLLASRNAPPETLSKITLSCERLLQKLKTEFSSDGNPD